MRVAMYVWGQGVYGKPLYLPHNFAMNLKLLLKKISFLGRTGKKRNILFYILISGAAIIQKTVVNWEHKYSLKGAIHSHL